MNFHSTTDFIKEAKKNVPKFVFDFIDGGAGTEIALRQNTNDFDQYKLVPFIRNECREFSLETQILGLHYAAPFGIAPLGLCGLVHPKADIFLAKAAAKYNVPYVMSAASSTSVSEITKSAGTPPWFQLYIPKSTEQLEALLKKADAHRCPVLVITVDTAVPGRRLRDLNNGLKLPYKLNSSNIIDAVKNPVWTFTRVISGKITFPNFDDVLIKNPNLTFSELMSLQTGGNVDWEVIKKIRKFWKRKLVLKGVLSHEDIVKAKAVGVDAVTISNHGGRQLSKAPTPISVLQRHATSIADKEFLMLDSGLRNGDDAAIALASGAGFVFFGRAFLYAVAAKGEHGVHRLFDILFSEVSVTLKLLGVNSIKELGKKNIYSEI